ncbi:polysaccharide lyase-like protein [Actinomycetospora succinea]|uniref:Polysaccharide lyase-like protein n=1 Tax=Actinomycetospora succinea TaxID=663603 RepID=A0A4R6ULE8_9PSEU|nr:polysaccharide lyase-like protein [Actinomycetospora succinea]
MPITAGEVRSHRRPPSVARARAVSLVAVGALAGGIAVASTSMPWFREASLPHPDAGSGGDASGTSGAGPGVLPAPPPSGEGPSGAVPAERPELPPAPAEAPPSEVWRGDGPRAFERTPWNTVAAPPPHVAGDEVSFHLSGRGQRSELEPAIPVVGEGSRHDVSFSVRLDGTFAPGRSARQVIARWENDSPGQAPLDLRVEDGELVLHGGEGHPSGARTFTRSLGPAPVGEWTRLRLLVRFSADPDKGEVSVWRDGRPVVVDDHPRGGTLYPGQQSYLKIGLHRDRTIGVPSTVRFGGWRVEHGAAADPSREAPARHQAVAEGGRRPAPPEPTSRTGRDQSDRDTTRTRDSSRDHPARDHSSRDTTRTRDSSRDHPARDTTRTRDASTAGRHATPRDDASSRAAADTDPPRDPDRDRASTETDGGGRDDAGERGSAE